MHTDAHLNKECHAFSCIVHILVCFLSWDGMMSYAVFLFQSNRKSPNMPHNLHTAVLVILLSNSQHGSQVPLKKKKKDPATARKTCKFNLQT